MPNRRLPPLNAVRAFEAAARHRSMTGAAAELGVTPGAVSRQVRDLEATIQRAATDGVEAVAVGTPIDLSKLVRIPVPWTRVRYELEVRGTPTLRDVLRPVLGS